MTALLLCEAGNLDRAVTVEAYDAAAEPTKLFIKPGEKYIRRNLLQAMLIKSANDCARCLARSHAGTESSFAVLMNKRAAMLGMRNSVFKNASGLPAEGQHSTARDMSLLARAALNQPVINQFVRLKEAAFTHADGRVKKLENTNHLLVDSPYCHGMKTGYTDAAGRCLVSCGTFRSRTVIVVVLGASAKSIWKESLGLLHWALGVPS
jgi:D-alanyl-D-alanine carboxypeptidase (penicillin-binding protein 5/6)